MATTTLLSDEAAGAEARAVFAEVDEALGQKLSALMFEGPEAELTLTANAQPALMAVSMAVVRVLEAEAGLELAPRVVELPLGATEDRVTGALDLERALRSGERRFEPGLLAAAHRGVLYIDEVNLLPDHLVDLLLDVAASGVNVVERDGVTVTHPARFILVGTMNPEEGDLRPQLLDRFGLVVEARTPTDPVQRAEVVRRRGHGPRPSPSRCCATARRWRRCLPICPMPCSKWLPFRPCCRSWPSPRTLQAQVATTSATLSSCWLVRVAERYMKHRLGGCCLAGPRTARLHYLRG